MEIHKTNFLRLCTSAVKILFPCFRGSLDQVVDPNDGESKVGVLED